MTALDWHRPSAFRVDLEQQRRRASDLLDGARRGDVQAVSRLAAARGDADAQSVASSACAPLTIDDARLAIARELRFANWAELESHIGLMNQARAAIDEKHPA